MQPTDLFASCVFNDCLRVVPPGATKCDFHKDKKQCVVSECFNQVVARGRCSKHGGRPRCAHDTCMLPAKGGEFCLRHGGVSSRQLCRMAGCSKQAHAKQLCVKHGGGSKCFFPGCSRHSRKAGLCHRHRRLDTFCGLDDDHIQMHFDMAYMWLLGQGVPSSNVVLCGDSAGGNAVLTLMQRGRRENAPLPACAILVSPWLDLTMTSPFYDVKTDIFTKRTIVAWRDVYLNNDVTKIHEASPGLQSLDGLPPLMVGDIATFVAKAKRCHVDVTEYLHPYLYHDFIIFPLGKPSRDAIHALAQFVVLKLDNHSNNTN
ncbi:hypothetical protein DYB38_006456 [Aphanomyces astaci]|uniref:Alpha/beta hydrolase fold-3 domain-containing protein n=1 Tax=Aphanomyces astaci TaxID=112090 RepID=A0A396ZUU7_APHAT|nr:hypothetical protein DYB36_004277 [Aphanomyces astaci]RHY56981.1 hypothetical protein DYB38_006456 [Aphanomyces astaci]